MSDTETYKLAAAIIAKRGKKAEFEISTEGPMGTIEWTDGGRHRIKFVHHWCSISLNMDRTFCGGAGSSGFRIPSGPCDTLLDVENPDRAAALLEVRKAVDEALNYLKQNKRTRPNGILHSFLASL